MLYSCLFTCVFTRNTPVVLITDTASADEWLRP